MNTGQYFLFNEITNTGILYPDLGGYRSIFSMQEPIRSQRSTPSLNKRLYSVYLSHYSGHFQHEEMNCNGSGTESVIFLVSEPVCSWDAAMFGSEHITLHYVDLEKSLRISVVLINLLTNQPFKLLLHRQFNMIHSCLHFSVHTGYINTAIHYLFNNLKIAIYGLRHNVYMAMIFIIHRYSTISMSVHVGI